MAAAIGSGQAQNTEPTPRRQFEVSSIKPSASGAPRQGVGVSPGGRLSAKGISLKFLIRFANNVQDFQVSGGPSWIGSDLYDIAAKANGDATLDQMRPPLELLLEDRFKLALHLETKELPVYELVEAKSGVKTLASKGGGCVIVDRNNPPRPGDPRPHYCGSIGISRGLIEAYEVPMQRPVSALSVAVGRTVIDRTGLSGLIDVHLDFTPDEVASGGSGRRQTHSFHRFSGPFDSHRPAGAARTETRKRQRAGRSASH